MSLNYKCPNCGGPMEFDPDSQKLKCQYCEFTLEIDDNLENQVESTTESVHEPEPEYDDYNGFKCPSCGAEIVTNDNTTSTFCAFCGNPTMVEERMNGVRRPSRLIPFFLDKNAAVASFKEWTKKGLLTPGEFRKKATIDKLTGVYVPFWLYDYDADVDMTARATRTRRTRKGDTETIYTDHFLVNRRVFVSYDKLPADASEKMDDDIMDTLEPFDYNNLKDFNMGFLSGYFSEKYDYTAEQLTERIEKRVKSYGDQAARDTILGYETVMPLRTSYKLKCKEKEYVYMPVWMLNYRWKGEIKTVAINGETGKKAGKLPISPYRVAAWWSGVTTVCYGLFLLIKLFT